MSIINKRVGKRIRAIREKHDLSLRKFGDTIGVTGSTVLKWETGEHRCPEDMLIQIGGHYGASLDSFYAPAVEDTDEAA